MRKWTATLTLILAFVCVLVLSRPAHATNIRPIRDHDLVSLSRKCAEDSIVIKDKDARLICAALEDIDGSILGMAARSIMPYCGDHNAYIWLGKGGPYAACITPYIR